jgi:hypothetical protein
VACKYPDEQTESHFLQEYREQHESPKAIQTRFQKSLNKLPYTLKK